LSTAITSRLARSAIFLARHPPPSLRLLAQGKVKTGLVDQRTNLVLAVSVLVVV
jgi:hypothetical protein